MKWIKSNRNKWLILATVGYLVILFVIIVFYWPVGNINYGGVAIGTAIEDYGDGDGTYVFWRTSYMTTFTLIFKFVCIRGDPFNERHPLFQKTLKFLIVFG